MLSSQLYPQPASARPPSAGDPPAYADPPVFGLRISSKGGPSAGRLLLTSHQRHLCPVVFRGRTSAMIWLDLNLRRWTKFIEIERLTTDQVAGLEFPFFPEALQCH